MLSNAYFLAKFRFDTAENEPAKNLQNLLILLTLAPSRRHLQRRPEPASAEHPLLDKHDLSDAVPGYLNSNSNFERIFLISNLFLIGF